MLRIVISSIFSLVYIIDKNRELRIDSPSNKKYFNDDFCKIEREQEKEEL